MAMRWTTLGFMLAALVLVCGTATGAAADTVYMKNGRVIRSSNVRVEGSRVFVRLYQGEVAFPLDAVERIVEDDEVEPTAAPLPPSTGTELDPQTTATDATQSGEEAAEDPTAGDPGTEADAPPEPAPEQTREYWQSRVRPLNGRLADIDAELRGLRSRTSADVQAQINRLEAQRAGVQAELDAIVREARRLGVPPGWLR